MPRSIAGLFNGEISWQHKASTNQPNSVKSWIKAFPKNNPDKVTGGDPSC